MVHGTVRSLFQLLGAIGMTGLVLAAWFGFRLSEGPVSLSFLSPYIEDALTSPNGGFTVKLDRTVLAWSIETRTLEIRAEGVRAVSPNQAVIASVPEMLVSLSGPALLHGKVVPRRLLFRHPTIRLVRNANGKFLLGLGESGQNGSQPELAVADGLSSLLEPPGSESAGGQLRGVRVEGGDLVVADEALGVQWHAPRTDLWFTRDQHGIAGHARIDLQVAGESARFDADGIYSIKDRNVETTLAFSGIRPSLFADLSPRLHALQGLHLPTGGTVGLTYSLDAGLTDLRFDLVGGTGVIDASLEAGVSWPVESVAVKGMLSHGLKDLSLDELRLDLGGPVVTVNGRVDDLAAPTAVQANAEIEELPVDMLKGLWPPELAPNPRTWILANLSHGQVRRATAEFAGHVPPGKTWADLAIDHVGGTVAPEGVTVSYLPPMQPVLNVAAKATFDADTFTIDVKSGDVLGLKLLDGKVILGGLSAPDQFADITLKIGGPVSDTLRLIDSKPLGWAQALGVQPAKVRGDAQAQLWLRFPLLAKLGFDQLKVHAQAQTNHLVMPQVALGLDLTEGALNLDIDPKGMDVTGKAQLGGQPADITWRENFTKGAVRSRYQIATALDDEARKMIGLDVAPFQPPFLSGPVPVEVTAVQAGAGSGEVQIRANLLPAAMQLPGLNWEKKAGINAQAAAELRLTGGRLAELTRFSVNAADGLAIQGQGAFDNGRLRRVVFQKAKWGRTDVTGTLSLTGDGLAIDLAGPSLDAREMISGTPSDHGTDRAPEKPDGPNLTAQAASRTEAEKKDVVPLTIQARVGQVWVSDDGVVKAVNANLTRDHRDWRNVRIDGRVGHDQPLYLEIQPVDKHRRSLKVSSADAGSVFRCFNVLDNVVGGRLTIDGFYNDADPRQPLKGTATVNDYQVAKAPALARLLTVAALTGIVELLQGEGIHFSVLDAPFTLSEGLLELNDARASGTSLGITVKGQIDLDTDVLALEGTVVPIYALNSALGNIPLLGKLFAGEKGGGVFAMNYSMSGPAKDPTVTVNPLSAFTPGMLRKLFDIFDTGHETEARPKEGPTN